MLSSKENETRQKEIDKIVREKMTTKLTMHGHAGKINKDKLIELLGLVKSNGKKWTQSEIACELGVSRPAITAAVKKIPKALIAKRNTEGFRVARADLFADFQKLILDYMTPKKLANSSIQQLGNLFKIFYEKEKLELGLATEHIAVIHKSNIDSATAKKIQEAVELATKKMLAEARQESLELAQGRELIHVN